MDARKALVTRLFKALDREDIEAALETLHPRVEVLDQIDERLQVGHQAVRDYWLKAFGLVRAESAPRAFRVLDDGALRVTIHHHVTSREGALWFEGPVDYRIAFEDGLIRRIDRAA